MARYINTADLCNVVMKNKTEYGRLATLIDNIVEGMVQQTPTADVVERSEYEKLRLVNLDLAETNKGLLAEHEQLLKLRSEIDKAIEEIKDNTFEHIIFEGGYDDNEDVIRPKETTEVIRLDTLLEILKEI